MLRRLSITLALMIAALGGLSCKQSAKSFTQSDCQRLAPVFDVAEFECREAVPRRKEARCTEYANLAKLALVLGCSFAPQDDV